MRPLLVIGDALLDRDVIGSVERLCPDVPVPVLDELEQRSRPGGAALAAALAASDGREVTLITALGADAGGRELAGLLAQRGIELIDLRLDGFTPEKVRLRQEGRSLMRLDRGGAPAPVGRLSAAARAAIGWAEAILVADYGRGIVADPAVRQALARAVRETPLVWDPHVRGPRPVAGVQIATPNQAEARAFGAALDRRAERPAELAGELVRAWRASHVAITCGGEGAVIADTRRRSTSIPVSSVCHGDTCGAGDRFSSAVAGALSDGANALEAVRQGVASAAAFVAAGAAGGVSSREPRPDRVPTVVATGGCFDLLHTGHVRTLEAARALGDRLIVCLNSDASVSRLKGPSRPVVRQGDRAAVLGALQCVDEVVIFHEDTPIRVLERVRPDIWAKGGDYLPHELSEAPLVECLGGRVVTLPYVEGHSTTRLLREVSGRAAN